MTPTPRFADCAEAQDARVAELEGDVVREARQTPGRRKQPDRLAIGQSSGLCERHLEAVTQSGATQSRQLVGTVGRPRHWTPPTAWPAPVGPAVDEDRIELVEQLARSGVPGHRLRALRLTPPRHDPRMHGHVIRLEELEQRAHGARMERCHVVNHDVEILSSHETLCSRTGQRGCQVPLATAGTNDSIPSGGKSTLRPSSADW